MRMLLNAYLEVLNTRGTLHFLHGKMEVLSKCTKCYPIHIDQKVMCKIGRQIPRGEFCKFYCNSHLSQYSSFIHKYFARTRHMHCIIYPIIRHYANALGNEWASCKSKSFLSFMRPFLLCVELPQLVQIPHGLLAMYAGCNTSGICAYKQIRVWFASCLRKRKRLCFKNFLHNPIG